jgi:hypothetical protein|nr:MAG TPA: hypothetical protein [Caudoviricetes sp.]
MPCGSLAEYIVIVGMLRTHLEIRLYNDTITIVISKDVTRIDG